MKHFAFGDIVWKAIRRQRRSRPRSSTPPTTPSTSPPTNSATPAPSATIAHEEISGNFTLIDAAADGVVDANDITFTATSGDQCEGILVYKDTGSAATYLLLFWWDTASGLPVTFGGDVTVSWDNGSNKIAAFRSS